MKKILLKEIAAHFNVSISAVSKAIHDSHDISQELRTKIQKFAKENNYRPNIVALNLLNKNTKTIGVVIPSNLNHFFTKVFFGIEKVANERGYIIVSCISSESMEKEIATLESLSNGTIDGLIISSLADENKIKNTVSHLLQLTDNQIPLVMFDRVSNLVDCDKVVVDDYEAGCKTTKYLIETGCRDIAVITPIEDSSVSKLRIAGYRKVLRDKNIPFDEKLVVPITKKDDLDLVLSFLLNYKKIDAIITLDEITGVKVMGVLKTRGYRIPDDISVVGFTNGPLSEYVTPTLTSVSQHGSFVGETAARMLIDRIEGVTKNGEYVTKTIKTSLIFRDSSRKI